jgi:8-oxo-dGTP diphosphatase
MRSENERSVTSIDPAAGFVGDRVRNLTVAPADARSHVVDLPPADISLGQVSEAMDAFVREKGWYRSDSKRPQTPRNLAASLSIEAGELLECFQWGDDVDVRDVEDELADVILYAVQLSRVIGCDVGQAVMDKLKRNRDRHWDETAERE